MQRNSRRTTLFLKMMAAYSLVILAVMVFTAAAFYYFATRHLESEAEKDMKETAGLTLNAIMRDQAGAALLTRLLSENYRIKTGVAARDKESVTNECRKELEALQADFVSVAGVDGVVFAHVGRNPAPADIADLAGSEPLFLSPTFQKVSDTGAGASGIEPVFPSAAGIIAIAPITGAEKECPESDCSSPERVGYVRIGFYLDERFIERIKEITGTDLAIEQHGTIVSSTFSRTGDSGREFSDRLSAKYLYRKSAVESGGTPVINLLTVYPKWKIREVQKRGLTIIGAIAALSLGGFIAMSVWVARRITEPLQELAGGVKLIEAGDLEHRMSETGRDEIGALAESFNRMTDALRRRDEELKLNQEQLIQSGKLAAIGELAAGVAHEIGNPLAAISGYLQLLKSAPSEKKEHYIEEIEKEAGFIDSIIRQLLDFSRPPRIQCEDVDVDLAIEEALRMLMFHKVMKSMRIEHNRRRGGAVICAGRKEFIQAVLNISLNAGQFAGGNGSITITTESDGKSVSISIHDDGPGITGDQICKIFEPFFTTRRGGTGLGLSITHRIVTNNNGTISVKSSPGSGTTFMMVFPAVTKS